MGLFKWEGVVCLLWGTGSHFVIQCGLKFRSSCLGLPGAKVTDVLQQAAIHILLPYLITWYPVSRGLSKSANEINESRAFGYTEKSFQLYLEFKNGFCYILASQSVNFFLKKGISLCTLHFFDYEKIKLPSHIFGNIHAPFPEVNHVSCILHLIA